MQVYRTHHCRHKIAHKVIGIIYEYILIQIMNIHRNVLIRLGINFEQNVQNWHNRHERKHIKPLRQKVQYQCPCQIFAVWKNIPLQQTKELFQHNYQLYIMPQR